MAIAPLLDTETADWSTELFGASWPRPTLQLVADTEQVPGGDWARARTVRIAAVTPMVHPGADVAVRRARRKAAQRRRRGVMLATLAAGLSVGLAVPVATLGGSPAAAHPQVSAGTVGGTVYVVRPGDTLWSIASRFDGGGDPRPMAKALARETGSAAIVPGEHLTIP